MLTAFSYILWIWICRKMQRLQTTVLVHIHTTNNFNENIILSALSLA